jgi:hypothetical protein
MDHKEQHHQHHQKEREERKKEQKEFEHHQEQSALPFHPAWLFGIGAALVMGAMLLWIVFLL